MTPVELSRTVLRAVRRAVDGGELSVSVPGRAVVTIPGPGGCGDYATNIALQLARPAGQPPRRVAEILRPHLSGTDGIADVVVTGPGFLNFSLSDAQALPTALVAEILASGARYGFVDGPSGQVVQLHAAREVRAVVVMDAVSRILRSQGALVRASCEGPPASEWTDVLGVRVDAYGTPEAPAPLDIGVRPVPAPADPVPLGRDAARWALLHPAAHDRPRITDEHLVQREGNPLFRVRYAHARTRALSRNAAELGFTAVPAALAEPTAVHLRPTLTPLLADHPRILAQAAAHHAPDRLARHLVTVADAVLAVLPTVLPRGDEKPSAAHRARLALAEAAGTVLAGGLSLLGIDAPEHL
ncbi:MAG: hypothetical protein HOQ47_05855 [Streptomyces sp.]|nr:hypothetical protein [Streptomyces sp.]